MQTASCSCASISVAKNSMYSFLARKPAPMLIFAEVIFPESIFSLNFSFRMETTASTSSSMLPEQAVNQRFGLFQQAVGKYMSEVGLSNYGRWLNGKLLDVQRDGSMVMEFTVRSEMLNPAQTLHGGVAAGMMDDLIGAAVYALGKKHVFMTVNLVVDYFAIAKKDDVVHAKVSMVKQGGTIIHVQCELWLVAKERMIARSVSNMIRTDVELPF